MGKQQAATRLLQMAEQLDSDHLEVQAALSDHLIPSIHALRDTMAKPRPVAPKTSEQHRKDALDMAISSMPSSYSTTTGKKDSPSSEDIVNRAAAFYDFLARDRRTGADVAD